MIANTDKDKDCIVHLKCPRCGSTLEYKQGKFSDYYTCPKCNAQNYNVEQIIYLMAQHIAHLEKSDDPNPQK